MKNDDDAVMNELTHRERFSNVVSWKKHKLSKQCDSKTDGLKIKLTRKLKPSHMATVQLEKNS